MLQYLQIANVLASPIICNLRDDDTGADLQNAKMNFLDLPNENFVAAWRERKGWTQAKLAEEIGTTSSVVSLLESGDRQLSPKWLRRIAAAFGIPTGYLLEHHPDAIPADVLEVWAGVPAEKREDALAVLRAFVAPRSGTDG
jgi:transcriptional regulator with XRE-family HTH domain